MASPNRKRIRTEVLPPGPITTVPSPVRTSYQPSSLEVSRTRATGTATCPTAIGSPPPGNCARRTTVASASPPFSTWNMKLWCHLSGTSGAPAASVAVVSCPCSTWTEQEIRAPATSSGRLRPLSTTTCSFSAGFGGEAAGETKACTESCRFSAAFGGEANAASRSGSASGAAVGGETAGVASAGGAGAFSMCRRVAGLPISSMIAAHAAACASSCGWIQIVSSSRHATSNAGTPGVTTHCRTLTERSGIGVEQEGSVYARMIAR
mmetsp:Transcript_47972/g.114180  ORF Transcript_47972/g.114180 Transcript_47972/m.114180 type:complete len:265 (-) Transcript_47972:2240-3034(-)